MPRWLLSILKEVAIIQNALNFSYIHKHHASLSLVYLKETTASMWASWLHLWKQSIKHPHSKETKVNALVIYGPNRVNKSQFPTTIIFLTSVVYKGKCITYSHQKSMDYTILETEWCSSVDLVGMNCAY